ncbi:MAG: NAD(P)H-dependent oxidoreductase [Pseudonocardia sp.]|nr:NAD(P)H-dependent oxidoreductase [Pseudonocardia sp.]MBO0873294.1 NAD(P)H-dependent oxidoreductase [Pseudonocardia sp.]
MVMRCRVLLVSGSLRTGSTNTAMLRTAQAIAPAGVEAVLYGGVGTLPHFNPDHDGDALPAAAAALREQIRASDAVLFSVPEYAGSLPGSLKNLLDWSIGDDKPGSIYEKPVAWINASPRGAAGAHEQLRQVLGYAHATIIEAACAHIPVTGELVDDDALIADPTVRGRIATVLSSLTSSTIP